MSFLLTSGHAQTWSIAQHTHHTHLPRDPESAIPTGLRPCLVGEYRSVVQINLIRYKGSSS